MGIALADYEEKVLESLYIFKRKSWSFCECGYYTNQIIVVIFGHILSLLSTLLLLLLILLLLLLLLLLLQEIAVKVNYNYFTLYKALK